MDELLSRLSCPRRFRRLQGIGFRPRDPQNDARPLSGDEEHPGQLFQQGTRVLLRRDGGAHQIGRLPLETVRREAERLISIKPNRREAFPMHSAIVVITCPKSMKRRGTTPNGLPAWPISVEHPNRWSAHWKIRKVF